MPQQPGPCPVVPLRVSVPSVLADVRRDAGRVVLTPHGDLDLHSAPTLRRDIKALVAAGDTDLTVDLHRVTFLDSVALGVLVGGLKATRSHGGLLDLAGASPRLLRLFRITGLDRAFTLRDCPSGRRLGSPGPGL